jgi:ribonuclease T1
MNRRKTTSSRARSQPRRVAWILYVILLLVALVTLRVFRGGPVPADLVGDAGPLTAPAAVTTPAGQPPSTPATGSVIQPATDEPTASPVELADVVAAEGVSGLPTIPYRDLPAEARTTLSLIQQDGPFPFARDGSTFQNRERLLPLKPANYYREYTVITPGANDRGARRVVAGAGGEFYYTDDHYASFREIVR